MSVLWYNTHCHTNGNGALFISSADVFNNTFYWSKHPLLVDYRPAVRVTTSATNKGCFAMKTKVCANCKREKPLADFTKREASIDGYHYYCRDCSRTKSNKWLQNNRESVNEQRRKVYQERKDDLNAQRRQMYATDEDYRKRKIQSATKWGKANRGKRKKTQKVWIKNNRERWNKAQRESRGRHVAKLRPKWVVYSARRRALLRNAQGNFSIDEWLGMIAYYDYTCLRCRKHEPNIKLTIDHIIPLSKGGAHSSDNIQPLCSSCNSRKSDKAIDYRPQKAACGNLHN